MKITRSSGETVPDEIGHVTYSASVTTLYAMGVPSENLEPKPGVQHWMMTDGYAATLGAAYFANCLASMDGVVYLIRWKDIETSLGVYSWTALDAAVSYVLARGKQIIIRLVWKSYTDANDPPLNPPIPAYMVSDSATYGGASGSGGMRKVYTLPTWAGWGAMLDNAAVYARFAALIDAIGARYGSSAALYGIGPDESTWGVSSPLPAELTAQIVIDTNKLMLQRMQSAAPTKKVVQWANFLDDGTIDQVLDFVAWGDEQGYAIGITDVFAIPQRAASMQHSYYALPASRVTVSCIEYYSYGANDATLSERMDDNYRTSSMLGSDIVAWANVDGASGAYWPHVLRVTGRS